MMLLGISFILPNAVFIYFGLYLIMYRRFREYVAMALTSWSDMIPSLKPYEDPNEVDAFDFEEVGDPRFGIVQVIVAK